MGILDRYIARQFLTNIILLFVVLFAFIIVIDFSLNFDEFLRFAEERLKARGEEVTALAKGLGAVQLELDLWLPRLPLLFNYLLGLVMVGAMGFTCAQMVQHREFVALLSGGISLRRAARPIIIVALAMLALTAVNREVLLPEIAPLLTRDKKDAGKRTLGMTQVSLSADGRGRLWQADRFDIDASRLEVVRVWERDADGLMTARITAAEATWDAQRRGWALKDGVAEDARAATPGGPMTRRAAIDFIETDLDPTTLRMRRFEGYSQNLSTMQLAELVSRFKAAPQPPLRRIEQLERIRYARIADPIATFLTLLICMPFFLRREPASMIVASLTCAPVALGALLVTLVGVTGSVPGLPPQLGVFTPVMVLLPIALLAQSSIKT